MIKVKGIDFKTVVLSDLNDRVYYGQERIYSDAQYALSKDLKKYIESGKLFVLENKPENSPNFVAPPQPAVQAPSDDRLAVVLDLVNTLKDKMDNLETKDERRLIWGSCFSIEPGIYKDGIGVRTELDVLIDSQGNVSVVGPEQSKLILLE